MEISRLTRDGTAKPVSRDQILRRERRQGNVNFSYLADHEQDWQSYLVDPYSAICDDHTSLGLESLSSKSLLLPSPSILPLRIGSSIQSPYVILLRKGKVICSMSFNDLVHSIKLSPSKSGIVLIICKVFIAAIS